MLTPEEQEIKKLEVHIEIILDIMNKATEVDEIQALDTAYWTMMGQMMRLRNQQK